jgi:hypothetical protein
MECGKSYTEEHERSLGTMNLPVEKAIVILQLLVE